MSWKVVEEFENAGSEHKFRQHMKTIDQSKWYLVQVREDAMIIYEFDSKSDLADALTSFECNLDDWRDKNYAFHDSKELKFEVESNVIWK